MQILYFVYILNKCLTLLIFNDCSTQERTETIETSIHNIYMEARSNSCSLTYASDVDNLNSTNI